ncbi:MAG: hypothetical protein EXR31_05270 [Betaproteobacteria bacterium]|nr:hypothetical protein [Betaproteobacteria bacterium]
MNYSEAFRDITTCDLSDGCDALGIVPVTTGAVKGVFPGCRPICGPVITCKMSPRGKKEIVIGTIEPIIAADPGSIFLVDAGGNMQHNTIGSLVTAVAVQSRLSGAIVDGCVRDVQGTIEMNFPTYSRGTVVQSVRGRVGIESIGRPVTFAGKKVNPGDIAAADMNGVIIFPASRAREIFEAAYRAVALERKIILQIRNGADFIAVHKALKYDAKMKDQLKNGKITG